MVFLALPHGHSIQPLFSFVRTRKIQATHYHSISERSAVTKITNSSHRVISNFKLEISLTPVTNWSRRTSAPVRVMGDGQRKLFFGDRFGLIWIIHFGLKSSTARCNDRPERPASSAPTKRDSAPTACSGGCRIGPQCSSGWRSVGSVENGRAWEKGQRGSQYTAILFGGIITNMNILAIHILQQYLSIFVTP